MGKQTGPQMEHQDATPSHAASSTTQKALDTALVLDWDHLNQQTYSDEDLARELLGMLKDQCLRLIPEILSSDTLSLQADSAHALKGAARGLGAWRMAALLDILEQELREGRQITQEDAQLLEETSRQICDIVDEHGSL
jgi:HPt (histidine-containing phosphotransfer) domain-containing protein